MPSRRTFPKLPTQEDTEFLFLTYLATRPGVKQRRPMNEPFPYLR